jgi:hypothetical protein
MMVWAPAPDFDDAVAAGGADELPDRPAGDDFDLAAETLMFHYMPRDAAFRAA